MNAMVLTYFQLEVRIQFFQLVGYTVSLDTSQLVGKAKGEVYFSRPQLVH